MSVTTIRSSALPRSTANLTLNPTPTPTPVPAVVLDVEVTHALPAIEGARGDRRVLRAWLLVRVFTEPIGQLLLDVPPAGIGPTELGAAIDARFGPKIRARLVAAGGQPILDPTRWAPLVPRTPDYLTTRAEVLREAPPITVVVCTRDRPADLRRCLTSLQRQRYPELRILVVDNAPTDDGTERVVDSFAEAAVSVQRIVERRPGLSRARNAAVAAAPGEILAWLDDDEVADPYWLAEVARALAEHPDADVVSGVIVPAELETEPQLWFEEFGGHSKGRGFTPDVFSPATAYRQSPLYPLPAFGTGANMVFRPGVIEGFGRFDPALGAGTPAMGSEDTHAFMKVLYGGGKVAYQPTALVRHYHRRDLAGLHRQLVGYGVGLTAAYTSLVLHNPRILLPLLRLLPTAIRDLLGGGSGLREAGLGVDFPRELLGANRRGMIRGPLAYLKGRRTTRRRSA